MSTLEAAELEAAELEAAELEAAGAETRDASLPPALWTLTWQDEPVKRHENLLARRTYRLENPDDPGQALWCYCDKFRAEDGQGQWRNRFAYSQAAAPVIRRLAQGDFHQGDFQRNVLAGVFKAATPRKSRINL